MFGIILLVIFVVGIAVAGYIAREYVATSVNRDRLFRKDITELTSRVDQLESDMAELKELVADTIIDTVSGDGSVA